VEKLILELTANARDLNLIDNIYEIDLEYHDPMLSIRGRKNMKTYFSNLNKMTPLFEVELTQVVSQEDTYVAIWNAEVAFKIGDRFESPIVSYPGSTIIKFTHGNAKVRYHRDYYDQSAAYAEIPLVKHIFGFLEDQMLKQATKNMDKEAISKGIQ